jgi:hypothetical protein
MTTSPTGSESAAPTSPSYPGSPMFHPGGWRNVDQTDASVSSIVRAKTPDAGTRPKATVGAPKATAASGIVVSDGGGAILDHVRVHLVFWGTSWAGTSVPSMGDVLSSAQSIVSGPYMDGLAQYRGIQPGVVAGSTLVASAVGNSPASPSAGITDNDIQNLLSNLIYRGMAPSPSDSELLYVVMLPPGVSSTQDPTAIGKHGHYTYYAFPFYWANVRWGWIMNFGTLDGVTEVFSHELAEACTDPDVGSGFVVTAGCTGGFSSCEIGDVCEGQDERINGVLVQKYFSVQHDQCIGSRTVKDTKDSKDLKDGKNESKETKDHKDNKEHKDTKDHKDKESAKDKEKDVKEKDRDNPLAVSSILAGISQQLDELARQLGTSEQASAAGQAFIGGDERPAVGEHALTDEADPDQPADLSGA